MLPAVLMRMNERDEVRKDFSRLATKKRTDRWIAALVTPALCLVFVAECRAELTNRGTYDGVTLIYDSVQRITWLGDANWAKTSGFDPDGEMTWAEARTWTGRLTIGGFSDWRLPITSDETCRGAGCTNSEMGHLFGVEGVSSSNSGLFLNVQERQYWSSRSDSSEPEVAWYVHFGDGDQGATAKSDSHMPWAVRDGDVGSDVSIETEPASFLARANLGAPGSTPVMVLGSVLVNEDHIDETAGDKAVARPGDRPRAGSGHTETLCAYNEASWDCQHWRRPPHRRYDTMIRRFR